jgi:hypothetical protein
MMTKKEIVDMGLMMATAMILSDTPGARVRCDVNRKRVDVMCIRKNKNAGLKKESLLILFLAAVVKKGEIQY